MTESLDGAGKFPGKHKCGVLFLLAGTAAGLYAADLKLPERSHSEAWRSRYDGSILKQFEWKVQPTISSEGGSLTINLAESVTKSIDRFAGVAGEIDFADGASRTLEVTFSDGSTSPDAHFEGAAARKTITKLAAHYAMVGHQWTLEWGTRGPAASDPDELPLPAGWSLAASSMRPAASAGEVKKGTWLTVSAMRDRPQDLNGIWIQKVNETTDAEPQQWFETSGGVLKVHNLSDPDGFHVSLKRLANSTRWEGSGALPHEAGTGFSTCPLPKGSCIDLCRWSPGFLDIPAGALQVKGEWRDRHIDSTRCVHTDEPQIGPQQFDRFVGVSFLPIKPGKYMYMGMAPGAGPNPTQFKAIVRLAADYTSSGAASVKASVKPATATLSRTGGGTLAGVYEFATHGHGAYELTFELARKDGSVFHTDRVRVEVPTVPGIGN